MPHVELFTDKDRAEISTFYQRSKLFLFPLSWEEPFGLVLAESMACGTPVIAYARGSVPEIIKDGKTGFIINSSNDDSRGNYIIKKTGIEGLCEAVKKIYAMPETDFLTMRRECRTSVEERFTAEHMAQEYMELYKRLLAKSNQHATTDIRTQTLKI